MKSKITKIVVVLLALVTVAQLCLVGCNLDNNGDNGDKFTIVSKSVYMRGEEIVLTASGDGDDWVGVYREKDDVKQVDPIASYKVYADGFLSGQSYIVQRSATFYDSRQAFKDFPAVKYKVVLFGDATKTKVLKTEYFSVADKDLTVPTAPTKLAYKQALPGSGFADGTLTVDFDSDNFNATELVLYWADDNGILTDWTSLAKVKISGNPFVYNFVPSSIIPKGATKLRAYSVNKKGTSENYAEVELSANSGFVASGTLLSSFNVVSDIHIARTGEHLGSGAETQTLHDAHLKTMAEDIVKTNPNSQALVIVGDIANSGRESEWIATKQILSSVSGLPQVYYSIGNHDLYHGKYDVELAYFLKYAEVDKVYYEKEIAGYTHIFLGSENSNADTRGVDAYIGDEQLAWLDARLTALTTADKNKQVFVYLHQSLYDTIAGSFKGQGWNGVMQDAKLRAVLKKFPQVYLFNGHSHWDMNSVGNLHNADGELPNILNTAAVAYLWDSSDNPTGVYLKGSQGYYVMVYGDKVVVKGRDFEQGKWIASACYALTNGSVQ